MLVWTCCSLEMTALVSTVSSPPFPLSSFEADEVVSRLVREPCILLTSDEISNKQFLSLPISSSFSSRILQKVGNFMHKSVKNMRKLSIKNKMAHTTFLMMMIVYESFRKRYLNDLIKTARNNINSQCLIFVYVHSKYIIKLVCTLCFGKRNSKAPYQSLFFWELYHDKSYFRHFPVHYFSSILFASSHFYSSNDKVTLNATNCNILPQKEKKTGSYKSFFKCVLLYSTNTLINRKHLVSHFDAAIYFLMFYRCNSISRWVDVQGTLMSLNWKNYLLSLVKIFLNILHTVS